MDGIINFNLKNGTEILLSHVTAFNCVDDEYRVTYESETGGYPMEIFKMDEVNYFIMW